jgi:tetratricopeptide (TPR) repeat protein
MNTDYDGDPEVASDLVLDDRPGPAPRISRERALAMVETAMAELPPPLAAPKRLAAGSKYGAVAAAVLLGVVGGAAAARWYFADRTPAAATTEAPTAAKSAAEPEPATVVQPPAATPAPTKIEPGEPDAVDSEPAVERSASVERGRAAPEDLLQKANRLRAEGRFREAAQTYSAVSDRYPKTLSSYVAQVAAASIELEHLSHAGKARRLFEKALKEHPEGALDLEARQGLATALRDLGQEKAEVEALRHLIDAHPASPAAKRAALRLAELGAN